MIWESLTLTLTQIAKVVLEGDAHITTVLGMGMPKTRVCPYHCNTPGSLEHYSLCLPIKPIKTSDLFLLCF